MQGIVFVSSLQEAIEKTQTKIKEGNFTPFLLSQLPPEDLLNRFKNVQYGIFDFDNTLVSDNQHINLRKHVDELPAFIDEEIIAWMTRDDKTFLNIHPEEIWYSDQTNPALIEQALSQAAFITKNVSDFINQRMSRNVIEYTGQHMKTRAGVKELFSSFKNTCIITYGFKQVVEAWAQSVDIKTTIAGLELIYDPRGKIIAFHPGSLVTGVTKGLVAQRFRRKNNITEAGILTLGDSIFDITMMYDHPQAVNALIIEPEQAVTRLNSFKTGVYKGFWEKINTILIGNDFNFFNHLLS